MCDAMKYISTSNNLLKAGFKEAVLSGLAADGGLFVPEHIPKLDDSVFNVKDDMSLHELAFQLLFPFVQEDLSDDLLRKIIEDTFQFDFPLVTLVGSGIHVLELFHGPTWAFKDVGARFLAGCLSAWNTGNQKNVILVATSGDTGGAVANGFFNQPGIDVVILYPKGKVSPLQEYQIAGLGGNITALAVDGTFDDCQRMVKSAFNDKVLRSKINITSANSINVARWLPQMIFYAIAWREMKRRGYAERICIPCGNYGNIAAAFLAHDMGMHFKQIFAAHNANDTIPRFLEKGQYTIGETIATLANAMDVSDPSNFVRLQYLFQHQYRGKLADFQAQSVTDQQILETIQYVWQEYQYLLDPHTATSWHMLNDLGGEGTIVATAHPYKFEEVIIKTLGYYPPEWNKEWEKGLIDSITIPAGYKSLEEQLLNKLKD
jgi:threonine synthase